MSQISQEHEGGHSGPLSFLGDLGGSAMCEKVDVEVRVYATGHQHGSVDWSVVLVHPDGQCEWRDGGSYRNAPGRAPGDVHLDQAVVAAMNSLQFLAGNAQFSS